MNCEGTKKNYSTSKKELTEKAREYALGNCGIETFNYLQNAFIAGVEFAQHWISVDEELPEIKEDVYKILLKYKGGETQEFWVRKKGYCADKDNVDFFKRYDITHWRPIELK